VRSFGDLEAAIMTALWDRPAPATVREIWMDLQPQRPLAYNTVLTVVDNLFKKGWLQRERDGRAFRYRPLASRADYGVQLMRDAMVESGDPAGSLVGFVRQLSPDESAALRDALEAYGRDGDPA
jgi:predicted transcriptional regulator